MKLNKLFRVMTGAAAAAVIFGGASALANSTDGTATFTLAGDNELNFGSGDMAVPTLRFGAEITPTLTQAPSLNNAAELTFQVIDERADISAWGDWAVQVEQTSRFTAGENELSGAVIDASVNVLDQSIEGADIETFDIEELFAGSGTHLIIAAENARFVNTFRLGNEDASDVILGGLSADETLATTYSATIVWSFVNGVENN